MIDMNIHSTSGTIKAWQGADVVGIRANDNYGNCAHIFPDREQARQIRDTIDKWLAEQEEQEKSEA